MCVMVRGPYNLKPSMRKSIKYTLSQINVPNYTSPCLLGGTFKGTNEKVHVVYFKKTTTKKQKKKNFKVISELLLWVNYVPSVIFFKDIKIYT